MTRTKTSDDKPAASPVPKRKAAEKRVQALRDFYEIGKRALASFPEGAKQDSETIRTIAEEKSLGLDMIRKAREFARRYTEAEFQVLCGLRTPTGMPLTFGHVCRLLAVKNKTKRSALQARAARLGWGVPELIAAIQAVQAPLSQGGRRPSRPGSPVAALAQITWHSEKWLRRCEKAWDRDRDESPLFAQVVVAHAKERESVQASLKRTRKALKQLSQAALALEERLGKIKVKDKVKAQATPTPQTASKPTAPQSNSQRGKKSR